LVVECTQARLQRIFEYPISCPEHRNVAGHILFHIFNEYLGINISVDMTAFTTVPIRGRQTDMLLTYMAIPENQHGLHSAELRGGVHEKCLAMTLEVVRELRASQYSMLAFLSNLPARLIAHDVIGITLCSEELAGMSIGVINALDLPSDPRVALLIPGVVSGILEVKRLMHHRKYREEWENQAADKEATIAINRLMTRLAGMKIFGARNHQILSCARNRETHSPAVGWLPMHID
jgi:hypothetical protein